MTATSDAVTPAPTLATAPGTSDESVRVLFIGGLGRSGSTLLDCILGELPGVLSLGEVVHLWRRGLIDNERCGCRLQFQDCPFWTAVAQEAFGGWDKVDGEAVLALQHRVDRFRYIPATVRPGLRPRQQADLDAYCALLGRLYRAISTVSGARVLVDSTKHASHAFLLRRSPDIDLRLVHLVRNSRGVAHSWTKVVKKPEVVSGEQYMPRYSPGRIALRYLSYNTTFHALGRLGVPRMFLRYESFVRQPREHVARILSLVDLEVPPQAMDYLADGYVTLGANHTVAGNPMRFGSGKVALRVDDRWQKDMDRRQQRLVAAVTWPLLLRYGYLPQRRVASEAPDDLR